MPEPPALEGAATGATIPSQYGTGVNTSATAPPKKPVVEQNPAFRMMGLPRIRLPSRNWSIFLAITGSFGAAIAYDKYQTRLTKQKWCDAVSHLADETLDPKTMPRRLTIYLSAPPGDGLRSAREHFHNYIKPILVAGAMDWDVVEGRKEGDVRYKTAERARRKRRRRGEGGEVEDPEPVDVTREKNGTQEWPGVGGDLVVGRHTWKEYVRGMHEGWLGPVDDPTPVEPTGGEEAVTAQHMPGQASLGDAPVQAAAAVVVANTTAPSSDDSAPSAGPSDDASPTETPSEEKKPEEEKLKPRNPPPYLIPQSYASAHLSPSTPEVIGPSTTVPFPHILGIRNTPIRIYRFLTRRRLADAIGRDVASAVLASSYRSYSTTTESDTPHHTALATAAEEGYSGSGRGSEIAGVLAHEEVEWWKTTWKAREAHEESVWIEAVTIDERIAARMRKFELTAEDEDRAKRIADGTEKVRRRDEES